MNSRMDRRRKIKEEKRDQRRRELQKRWADYQTNRQLAKKGKTNRRRTERYYRYRQVDKILNRIIIVLVLLTIIVWLIIFFV